MSQTLSVPEGYKLTEVGVIPEDWELARLGELSEFITSGSRGWARRYSDVGPLFIRSQNIREDQLDFTDRQCVIPPAGSEGSRTKLNVSDLLITITGNNVGNVAWLEQDIGEAYISQHVGLVRLLDSLSAEYVCIFLAPGSPGNGQIWANQAGQSKPGLNLKNLEDFLVALPPAPEQRAIATALSDVDALLAKIDQLIAKKRDLKQAAMQQLLTGKTRLPGFSGAWEVKRLGDVLKVRHGRNQHDVEVAGGIYPILASGGEIGRTNSYLYDKPSVLIGRKGTIDKPRYQDEPFWTVDTLFYTEVFSTAHPKFIYYQFLMIDWRSYNEASGVPSLNASTIETVEINVPKFNEQTAIATVLSDMDAELTALEARRDKTRALKQGMMQALLTGRIRLL